MGKDGGRMNCTKCGSEKISIERRIDGFKICLDCGFRERNISQAGHVVLTIHENRRYKNCMCVVCGRISKCTPTNDFYSTPDHGEKLVCERCFSEYVGHKLNKKEEK